MKITIQSLFSVLLILGFLSITAPQAHGETVRVPVLSISGMVVDRAPAIPFFSTPVTTLRQKVDALDRAAGDDSVGGVLIRYEMPIWTFAQASEFQEALVRFKESGKPVYAHFDAGTMIDYLAITPADHISMSPVGIVDLAGLGLSLYYFKDLLGKLGIEAESIQTGDYKNAFEPFTENAMTEATREQMNDLLDDLFDHGVSSLSKHRDMEEETATGRLTGGPYTSMRAVELDIVDSALQLPDFLNLIREELDKPVHFDRGYSRPRRQAPKMPSLMDMFGGGFGRRSVAPAAPANIALVYAGGPIIDGRSNEYNPFLMEQVIASEDFIELLSEIEADESVRAIVIRIDSPGGSAIASDRIHHALAGLRKKGVPVIASMGSVAASGGYYIAMEADRILAQPTTLTGSIGVVAGKMSLEGTFKTIGIHREHLHRGENTEIFTAARRWTDRERELLGGLLSEMYDAFTTKAASSRGMDHEELLALAGGRVFTGTGALNVGLVDELGGLARAIEVARELADAPGASVVVYPKEPSLLEMIEKIFTMGVMMQSGQGTGVHSPEWMIQLAETMLPREARGALGFLLHIREGGTTPLAFMPWVIQIR